MFITQSKWQLKRSRFNHDWLKNQYIPALESFRNSRKGKVNRTNFVEDFIEIDLPQWEIYREEAEYLINEFENCMSPKMLFNEIPLCCCNEEAKNWIGGLVHTLWLVRFSVSDFIEKATVCFKNVDTSYNELKTCIERNPNLILDEKVDNVFNEFRKACHNLAGIFEQFPQNVNVV